jgi:hypothetical protein
MDSMKIQTEYIPRVGMLRNAYKIVVHKANGKKSVGRPAADGKLLFMLFISIRLDDVPELWTPTGLFTPQLILVYLSMEPQWTIIGKEKLKNSKKASQSATLSTTNPTWTNLGLRGVRPATNPLIHGTTEDNIKTNLKDNKMYDGAD